MSTEQWNIQMNELTDECWIDYEPVVGNLGELEIVEMRVPLVVETGSTPSVVLDCDYVLRRADKRSQLVVQWYFANQTTPVYQWIPGKKPQDLGVLKGRLNLDYRASSDQYKRHRALQILKPTSDLSGRYRCKVATVEKEVVAARNMIVYSTSNIHSIYHRSHTILHLNKSYHHFSAIIR